MLTLYRGHWLVLLCDRAWWCEITEIATREILPTAVTAELGEGPEVCVTRAKALVDRYADGLLRVGDRASGTLAQRPPAISMKVPVTYEAASPSSQTMASATSWGVPARPSGVVAPSTWARSGRPPEA